MQTPPDTSTPVERLGCGVLLGAVVASSVGVGFAFRADDPLTVIAGSGLVGAVVCGVLAWRFGDRFFKVAGQVLRLLTGWWGR